MHREIPKCKGNKSIDNSQGLLWSNIYNYILTFHNLPGMSIFWLFFCFLSFVCTNYLIIMILGLSSFSFQPVFLQNNSSMRHCWCCVVWSKQISLHYITSFQIHYSWIIFIAPNLSRSWTRTCMNAFSVTWHSPALEYNMGMLFLSIIWCQFCFDNIYIIYNKI